MCGDGANDCGALKAAHAGISLSEAEASVASPFTSAVPDISCVTKVIREGRAALVTSFGVFKFVILYAQMEFVSTSILYAIGSTETDYEYLVLDLFTVLNFALWFGRNKAYSGPLVPQVPLARLLSWTTIISLLSQWILNTFIQLVAFFLVQTYPWFVPFNYVDDYHLGCYENYAVYAVSQFQYITMAVIYSQGAPYREPLYKNKILFFNICLMTCVFIYITIMPAEWVKSTLQLVFPPSIDFPVVVLGLALFNAVVGVVLEQFVVQYLMMKRYRHCNHDLQKSRRRYLVVNEELTSTGDWPPISTDNTEKLSVRRPDVGHDNKAFEDAEPGWSIVNRKTAINMKCPSTSSRFFHRGTPCNSNLGFNSFSSFLIEPVTFFIWGH